MGLFNLFGRKRINYEHKILSPDGRIACIFALKQGHLTYAVEKDEKVVLKESRLGIKLMNERPFGDSLTLVRLQEKSYDKSWETQWGEDHWIRNNYREATFYLSENTDDHRLLTIRFKVFDNGVAFRYEKI